ncbi:MAG: hypothetical protein UIB61_07900 [Treponema sp.]|nr:hypothetical protein [Treponema sp.]
MKIKLSLKKVIISIVALIIFLIALFLVIIGISSHRPTAAFYGISESNQEKIAKVLQSTASKKKGRFLPFNIVTLDTSVSLENALKKQKADIVFVNRGKNSDFAAARAVKKHTTFDIELLRGMTTSVRKTAFVSDEKVAAVPLLLDNYELDVHTEKFNSSNIKVLNTLDDLEKLAWITKSSTPSPIIFPGGDNDFLINIFGALVEAVSGKSACIEGKEKLEKLIDSGKANYNSYTETLKELFADGNAYSETFKLLRNWSQKEILTKNVYQINVRDMKIFMQSEIVTAAFQSLSEHRTFERPVIAKYTSVYIPAETETSVRFFTSPVILGISLSKDKIARAAIEKLSNEFQSQLSFATGLAPVQANCSVPDVQADDVRYWVAASDEPLPALADWIFTTKGQKNAFAEALRNLLRA